MEASKEAKGQPTPPMRAGGANRWVAVLFLGVSLAFYAAAAFALYELSGLVF